MNHHITALYNAARGLPARDEAWETLRQAEAAEMPTCVNHPGRLAIGGFDDEFYCAECIGWEIRIRKNGRGER